MSGNVNVCPRCGGSGHVVVYPVSFNTTTTYAPLPASVTHCIACKGTGLVTEVAP